MTDVATQEKPSIRQRVVARLTGRRIGDAAPRVGYRSLFLNRDYRLLFSGLTISMSGSWAYNVALVVFVFNATHSAGVGGGGVDDPLSHRARREPVWWARSLTGSSACASW